MFKISEIPSIREPFTTNIRGYAEMLDSLCEMHSDLLEVTKRANHHAVEEDVPDLDRFAAKASDGLVGIMGIVGKLIRESSRDMTMERMNAPAGEED